MKSKRKASQKMKKGMSLIMSCAMAVTMLPGFLVSASETDTELIKAGSLNVTADTMTMSQPFPTGTGGSYSFRIPDLISLENGQFAGNLVAAADARYATPGDGGGLDTIASVSTDLGKTWNYSFPIWFPDSEGYAAKWATTVIDPALVEGPDGTIYCMADVNPTGITTHYGRISMGTGFVEINGKKRLALTDNYANTGKNPASDTTSYPYYVGEYQDGYAPVLRRADNSATDWRVDEWFNIEKKQGGTFEPLTQTQVDTDTTIQQNAFYKDSELHVFNIGYIWMVESKDGGNFWENPRILNDQVKPETGESYILVSPGKGLTTSKGAITVPFYGDQGGEKASFIYSYDNGKTWKRTNNVDHTTVQGAGKSSESEMVELSDGTLRMFSRTAKNGVNCICYTDVIEDVNGDFTMGSMVSTGVACWADCNVTAIRYSKQVDGKDLVLVACPSGTNRTNGRIYSFLVNNDQNKTMELLATYDIPNPERNNEFAYSCMTEQKDGTVGILWEPTKSGYIGNAPYELEYSSYDILELAPNAAIEDTSVNVELSDKKASYTRSYRQEGAGIVTQEPDSAIANVSVKNAADNTVEVKITKGNTRGTTTAVVDGVTYAISVTDGSEKVILEQGGSYTLEGKNAEIVSGNAAAVKVEQRTKYFLSNHVSNTNVTANAFSAEVDKTADLDNSLLTFTNTGNDTWRIKSEFIDHYLANTDPAQAYYFDPIPADMTVETAASEQGTVFHIKNSENNYYVCYYDTNSNFDRNVYNDNWTMGTFDLVLFEKKDAAEEGDLIPGYERASEIVSGGKYLVTCIKDNDIIVLYPYTEDVASWTNANAVGNSAKKNRTKLFRNIPTDQCTITGLTAGETVTVRVNQELYTFQIDEPVSKEAVKEAFTLSTKEEADALMAAGRGDYTVSSWSALESVCKKIQGAGEELSTAEMKELMEELKTAKENLSKKGSENEGIKEQVQKALAAAKSIYDAGQKEYTAQSWANFKAAYEALNNSSNLSNETLLKRFLTNLQDAQARLVKDTSAGKNEIKVGSIYVSGSYNYKITSVSASTVEFKSIKGAGAAKVTIPDTVKIDGKSYKVTAVAASAFKNNKKMTSVTIGKNVETIGNNAFLGCTKLKKVNAKSTVLKTIGSKAFGNCKSLKNMTLKTKKLKKVGKNAFQGIHKKAVIKVPSAKYKAYTKLLAKKGQSKSVKIKK